METQGATRKVTPCYLEYGRGNMVEAWMSAGRGRVAQNKTCAKTSGTDTIYAKNLDKCVICGGETSEGLDGTIVRGPPACRNNRDRLAVGTVDVGDQNSSVVPRCGVLRLALSCGAIHCKALWSCLVWVSSVWPLWKRHILGKEEITFYSNSNHLHLAARMPVMTMDDPSYPDTNTV